MESWTKEDWSKPMNIIAYILVGTIIAVLIMWYFFHSDFDQGGSLGDIGWVSTRGGIFTFLLILLLMAGTACTFALSFAGNGHAFVIGLGTVAFLSLFIGLSLHYARNSDASTFVVLLALGLVGAVGITVYGFRSLYISVCDKKLMESDPRAASIRSHYKASRWTAGASLIAFIGLIVAAISIHKHIAH